MPDLCGKHLGNDADGTPQACARDADHEGSCSVIPCACIHGRGGRVVYCLYHSLMDTMAQIYRRANKG